MDQENNDTAFFNDKFRIFGYNETEFKQRIVGRKCVRMILEIDNKTILDHRFE